MITAWVLLLCIVSDYEIVVEKSFTPVVFTSKTQCEETAENQIVLESYRNEFGQKEIVFICKPLVEN